MRFSVLASSILCVIFCCGCGSKVPEGFPKVVPFTIELHKAGQPIEGATLALMPTAAGGRVSVVGSTDTSGTAQISTVQNEYRADGAPVGAYKLCVEKQPRVEGELPQEELYKMPMSEGMAYTAKIKALRAKAPRIVPDDWVYAEKTPISVDVPAEGGSVKIEVNDYMK